ncbi:MAG TPA: glycogen debranching protein GlgX, partial [Actinomycetota bacterium]|nr:glycogen debranching protein GlgX [Actinomycetota bacterium]
DDPALESHRIPLAQRTASVWHVYLPDVRPGQLYGYRVDGPFDPDAGHWFNPAKLLIDPYARAVAGRVRWNEALLAVPPGEQLASLPDPRDSAGAVPPCVVVDDAFTWGDDRPPRTPWNRTVIYECHVRGMTIRHPEVPAQHRGTYLGLASDPVIEHLTSLGVTAVELLPVHQSFDEYHLSSRGLRQYWGYNSIGFFAPELRYATGSRGEQVSEFRTMVKTLHQAGLEVILDVVYNHTGEGSHQGPVLSFRGIDNVNYYHLHPDARRHYNDFSGTGNSVRLAHPNALQLVMDSLRYWVEQMHVDGFRFDLAPIMARDYRAFDRNAAFFRAVQQDPVLSQVKMIAEPWDLGEGGYQLGNFPAGWGEWNDRYRNCIRRFWRGDDGQVPELASRLAGSSDIFEHSGRGTEASINFVTAHDGFTLNDLVTYTEKRNLANGEDNRDGNGENYSSNWGEEGPSTSPRVVDLRERMKRNFLATLLFSQGVPMILGGDEIGRTQLGNNNAYCQDNEISWVDWNLSPEQTELAEFTRRLIEIYRENPVLRRRRFFSNTRPEGEQTKDLTWLRPDGSEMTTDDWRNPHNHVLGMMIPAYAADELDDQGRPAAAETLLLLL